jgi:hypothetical protein
MQVAAGSDLGADMMRTSSQTRHRRYFTNTSQLPGPALTFSTHHWTTSLTKAGTCWRSTGLGPPLGAGPGGSGDSGSLLEVSLRLLCVLLVFPWATSTDAVGLVYCRQIAGGVRVHHDGRRLPPPYL